jgi:hypothetical protein
MTLPFFRGEMCLITCYYMFNNSSTLFHQKITGKTYALFGSGCAWRLFAQNKTPIFFFWRCQTPTLYQPPARSNFWQSTIQFSAAQKLQQRQRDSSLYLPDWRQGNICVQDARRRHQHATVSQPSHGSQGEQRSSSQSPSIAVRAKSTTIHHCTPYKKIM